MCKIFVVLGGIAAATAFGLWSASTVANSRVGKAEVVAASAAIAPHELMGQLGRSIPAELLGRILSGWCRIRAVEFWTHHSARLPLDRCEPAA